MPLREIVGPAGRLEVLLNEPALPQEGREALRAGREGRIGPRAAVVLAHAHPQHGGTMHMKVLYHSAKAFARIHCAVLRFNFRGTGLSAGRYDDGLGEQGDFQAALNFMRDRYPDAPLWAAGMSFGAWIAILAGAEDPRVSTLIGISTPASRYDFGSACDGQTPKFFVHGERDEISSLKQMREFYGRAAEPKELVVIDGADHLFDGKVSEVAEAIEDLCADWPVGTP